MTTRADLENLDRIIDALQAAGCCRNGCVYAVEDVVANAIRDFIRAGLRSHDEQKLDDPWRARPGPPERDQEV